MIFLNPKNKVLFQRCYNMNTKKVLSSSISKVVIFTFITGMIIHAFGLLNVLHNYDDIYYVQGYGAGMSSGRWGLALLGDFAGRIWGNYNLPFINGMVFLFFVAISAGFLYSLFQFESWKKGALMGLIFVSFPSVTSVLFFKYTAIFYGFAILLSVIAVWSAEKIKFGIILSAICIAFAAGIYQAYLPLTISLFVLVLIKHVLEKKCINFKEFFSKGIYYCCNIILGMLLYFGALKFCLKFYNVSLSNYQGVSEMGNLKLSEIPALIKRAMALFFKLPISDYCNLASTGVLKLGYFVLGCICILVVIKWGIVEKKKTSRCIMLIILAALFPVAVNFIVIMCPQSDIYTLMVYSFVVVLFVPLILIDKITLSKITKSLILLVLCIMTCNFVYLTNVNYTAMYYTDRQTENYLNSMITQIRSVEGYDTLKKWAFIGERIEDPLINNPWGNVPFFGGNEETYINRYSRMAWVEKYFGYLINMEEEDIINRLKHDERVIEMPCWPNVCMFF